MSLKDKRRALEEKYGVKLTSAYPNNKMVLEKKKFEKFDVPVVPGIVLICHRTATPVGVISYFQWTDYGTVLAIINSVKSNTTNIANVDITRVDRAATGELIIHFMGAHYVLQSLKNWKEEYIDVNSVR